MHMHNKSEKTEDDLRLTIAQISHEIKNPLTYINSSIQWIQKLHPEVESFEYWDQLKSDLAYIQILLDDISILNHSSDLNIRPMDLKEFAMDVKDTLLPELLRRHIPLMLKLDENYPEFYADPIRLKQAVINLVKNSMESISDRGRITLKIFAQERKILIAVRDNGCGISPEQQENIFQPFVTYKKNGTGLGLSIARQVATAHGGTIRLHSNLGKGTEVQLLLPITSSPTIPL